MCITLFCTFLYRPCTTTTWKCLIASFMEDVNKRRRISFSLSKLESGPEEINPRENRLHLPFSANWNKREFFLKLTFSLQLPLSLLKLPISKGKTAIYENSFPNAFFGFPNRTVKRKSMKSGFGFLNWNPPWGRISRRWNPFSDHLNRVRLQHLNPDFLIERNLNVTLPLQSSSVDVHFM